MQWIDFGLVTPAAAQALSAAANALTFWRYARAKPSRARRVASTTLAMLCGVLLVEAGLFLVFGSLKAREAEPLPLAATLLVRWALLGVTALLSALIWRSPLRRG